MKKIILGIFFLLLTNLQHIFYGVRNGPVQSATSTIDVFSFDKPVKVYLPPGYNNDQQRRFPVLYLLHGFPGSNSDWLINANLQNTLDELVARKELPPLLVVFPDGNNAKGDYWDENYILAIVNEVDSRYRTLAYRNNRAIGGLSAGGYGAMNIGLHHNDLFSIIVSHSGYFPDDQLTYLQSHDLDRQTYIYLDIGKLDRKNYLDQNRRLDELLKQKSVEHEFNIKSGWHNWEFWRKNIVVSLKFINSHLQGEKMLK